MQTSTNTVNNHVSLTRWNRENRGQRKEWLKEHLLYRQSELIKLRYDLAYFGMKQAARSRSDIWYLDNYYFFEDCIERIEQRIKELEASETIMKRLLENCFE